MSPAIGALVASTAMVGDLFSSFAKRRLNFPPSSQAIGLDQMPESLLPMLACRDALSLTTADIALGVGIFFSASSFFRAFCTGSICAIGRISRGLSRIEDNAG